MTMLDTLELHLHTNGHASVSNPRSVDRFGGDWAGRSALVVGLGKSGAAAARWLQSVGACVRVTESAHTEVVQRAAAALQVAGIEQMELGGHSPRFCDGAEVVVVSPGVPETVLPIQWAQAHGIPIMSEIELAFRFCPAPIVAVTGTNGKSSVVTLLQRLLEVSGKHAIACGNLGIPFSDVLPALTTTTVVVVEVSSFQLLWCETFRPAISVLLNISSNHLDRHRNHDQYVAAKARLFRRQTPEDFAVLNATDAITVELSESICAQHIWFGGACDNPPGFALDPATCRLLPVNVQAVLQVGRLLGIPDPLSHQVIREFRGLEHRLEYVGTLQGVHVVNDSKSTTPNSLLYALGRCPGSVVPIIGGRDKGMNMDGLPEALTHERVRGVVLIGEARARLHALLRRATTTKEGVSLEAALQEALLLAHPGDTILFSPGFASFDMFRNFEERGRLFKQLVQQLVVSRTNGAGTR